jgi:hypothetical protein
MKTLLNSWFQRLGLVGFSLMLLAGCAMNKPHEQEAQIKAEAAGLTALEKASFDGTFVAPGANFSQYKKLLVNQLNVDDVEIRKASSSHSTTDTPWELTAKDKIYYQQKYTDALINNLVADGTYATAMNPAADVLLVDARLLQIAPLASKDDTKGRPGIMKVYSEGFGTMTLELTLTDSVSGKVLAIITDQRDLGRIWEENNRTTNNQKIRLAFHAWLYKLRTELLRLSA